MGSRVDEHGRTRYSISIGDRLVVCDALSTDGAVIAARRWVQARENRGRVRTGSAGGGRGTSENKAQGQTR